MTTIAPPFETRLKSSNRIVSVVENLGHGEWLCEMSDGSLRPVHQHDLQAYPANDDKPDAPPQQDTPVATPVPMSAQASTAYDPRNPQPGIYTGVPSNTYHASAGISSSMVMDFAAIGAYKYNLKRKAPKEPPSRCLVSGTLLHSRSLDKELTLPEWAVMMKFKDFRTKEAQDWRDNMEESGVSIVKEDQWQNIKTACKALSEHKEARSLLFCKGASELSMVAVDPETGITMRCRPDKLPETHPHIVDLKSTRDCGEAEFGKDAGKLRYHAKAAWYLDVCALLGLPKEHFVWVSIEADAPQGKTPSFEIAIDYLEHDSPEIQAGRMYYKKHLKELALCLKHDKWPMRCEGVRRLKLPYWAIKGELDAMADGVPY